MPTSETPTAAPASPPIIPPEPSKVRRKRADLQARAAASAKYRKRLKTAGLPTSAQIDAAIAGLTVRLLTTMTDRIVIAPKDLPNLVAKIVMWGRWEHLGEDGTRIVEAHVVKLKKKGRPKARGPAASPPPQA